MKETIIKVEDLTVAYDSHPVLWDVDVSMEKGKLIAIVGPNGAGKSTLIKSMLDFMKPITGSVRFYDKPYKDIQKKISYVPQKGSVDWNFPITVKDVVLMGRYGHLGLFKRVGKEDRKIAKEAMEKVGIYPLKNRQISELSGGQQQRVFLGRALAQKAEIYFMDEPFQGVDAKTERTIVALFHALKKENKTLIVVHHDLETVPKYFDTVILLNRSIIAQGPIDETFTKENIDKTYQNPFDSQEKGV